MFAKQNYVTYARSATRYEKQLVVHAFLDSLQAEYRLHWNHTIDTTYNALVAESKQVGCMRVVEVDADMTPHGRSFTFMFKSEV